jgi:hypothetical protein
MLPTRTPKACCQAAAQQQQVLAAPRPVACLHAAAGRVNLASRLGPVRCPHAPTQSRSKISPSKIAAALAEAPVASQNGKEQQHRPLRWAAWAAQQLHALLGYLLCLAWKALGMSRLECSNTAVLLSCLCFAMQGDYCWRWHWRAGAGSGAVEAGR